jgi:hypothetical protein
MMTRHVHLEFHMCAPQAVWTIVTRRQFACPIPDTGRKLQHKQHWRQRSSRGSSHETAPLCRQIAKLLLLLLLEAVGVTRTCSRSGRGVCQAVRQQQLLLLVAAVTEVARVQATQSSCELQLAV